MNIAIGKRERKRSNGQETGLLKVGVRDRRCEEGWVPKRIPDSGSKNWVFFDYSSVYSGGMWVVIVEPSTELKS
ncbi:hypothetical protein DVH24_022085 [Malus domestica]|uniref:Uncharacterized protein n=1 Tax=Malus domestica TaxID=3750 RepID=A0A498IYN0_MALDO|nr:hypothetical protein DVH24_022085 [Malus domestica]